MGVKRVVHKPRSRKGLKPRVAASTATSRSSLADQLRRARAEAAEARTQQAATAEVLKVIASSPSDAQPAFEAIVRNFVRLSGGLFGAVFRFDGKLVHFASAHGFTVEQTKAIRAKYPVAPDDPSVVSSRAILSRAPVVIEDIANDRFYDREHAYVAGWRRIISVPMVRDGAPLGAIVSAWTEPGPILQPLQDLLQTFADQAVIAIENARLFNETKESLERQTATAEILKVIAGSPTDVQPVFNAIVGSAAQLFGCKATIHMREGDWMHINAIADTETDAAQLDEIRRMYPVPSDPGLGPLGSAIARRSIVEVADTEAHDVPAKMKAMSRKANYRSFAAVPLVREGAGIGVLGLSFARPGRLDDKQKALARTFADQAVIAIENVRLFNETKEALERQTATAEVLRVISSSPTSTLPVFDAILERATMLCGAPTGILFGYAEGAFSALATIIPDAKFAAAYKQHLRPLPGSKSGLARLARGERFVHIPDMLNDPAYAEADPIRIESIRGGMRSWLGVPLLKDNEMIGALVMYRGEPQPFGDQQISLLQTFAEQAVVAIENVRLFKELQSRTEALTKSVGQLQALSEVGQAIGSTLDLETVLKTIVTHAVKLAGLDSGGIYEFDEGREEFRLRAAEGMRSEITDSLRHQPIRKGEGAVGRTAVIREPVQVPDVQIQGYDSRLRDILLGSGRRAVLAVPLLREGHILGALAVQKALPGPFAPEVVELLKTFAAQSAMAIQNARLYREIAEKGKQLEEASKHKSQFLASMSHELRTPLNAILGFNEMMLDGLCGEAPEGFTDPLNEVQKSGKHLLRLINNVLDLAKIEAGRMELVLGDYSVQDLVEGIRSTLRPLAAEKGLEFVVSVPEDLPLAYGDSGRLSQCLINLAGNSLKFTKQGKVEVSVSPREDLLVFRVADTGIGIAPDKIEGLFMEFKQTDATIASEYGGSGLGLSIVRKFVEMHGGRIWVESELGKGSTFLFEVPVRTQASAP